jgi:hypothetical protein
MRHATVLTASARRALVFTEIESAAGGGWVGGWVGDSGASCRQTKDALWGL